MVVLDGNAVSKARRQELATRIAIFKQQTGIKPGLAVVLVGEDPASQVYVAGKEKACEQVGVESFRYNLPSTTSQVELDQLLIKLNGDTRVHGILVQFPLPGKLEKEAVLRRISPLKDADGLSAENLGLLWGGCPRVAPCTPSGVMSILRHYQISLSGKRAVVVGRSHLVGLPMAQLLQMSDATVTVCHSKTTNIREYLQSAEVAVIAAGKPRLFGREDFNKDAVVIDVGIHRLQTPVNGKSLCGDVRYEELDGWARAATPVPGGVGPMTITTLLENTVALAELSLSQKS